MGFDSLLKLDSQIFMIINRMPHPIWLNYFILSIDYLSFAGVAWLLFCLMLIIFGRRNQKTVGILGIILVLFTTFIEGELIKSILIKRPRPFVEIPNVVLLGSKPLTFSFPSGQVANVFAVGVFFYKLFKKRRVIVLSTIFGIITAFGRVYLGAHYPLDVIGGLVIGVLCGYLAFLLFSKTAFYKRVNFVGSNPKEN